MAEGLMHLAARGKPALRRMGLSLEVGLGQRIASTLIAPPGKEIRVRLDGLPITLPPDSPSAAMYRLGWYELEVREWITTYLKPGMGFVDGGAFAGYYTVLAARCVGDAGRVWSFEPDPKTRPYLARNVTENQLGNVEVSELGLTDRTGTMPWVEAGRERGRVGEAGDRTIATTTLDDFFAARGWPQVDLAKLDIEAGEARAVRGVRALAQRTPGLRVLVEVLPASMRQERGLELPDLVAALREAGLVRGTIIERKGLAFDLDHFPDPPEGQLFNVVMSR